jgi:tetratricopeptide (TPR) repeat protein
VAKKKQIIKELKRPDQFVDFWTHAGNRIVAVVGPRRKPALSLAVAMVVVLVGAAIFEKWDGDKRITASEALAEIQKTANAELDTPTADPLEKKDVKDDAPHFKTAAERQAAVLKALDTFLAQHGGTALKDEALVMKGSQLLDARRFDDAVAAFRDALGAKLDARLRFLAHEGLGYAYEGKGDLDQALAAFGQLEGDASAFQGFYRDRALYQKARITERKGDKPGAAKLYQQVLDKVPDTLLHDEISDRLAVLEAK